LAGAVALVAPSEAHKDSYRALVAEFVSRGESLIPFTLSIPNENFGAFVATLRAAADGVGVPPGFVPNSTFFLVEGGEVAGVSNLRHALTERLRREGGHIGYGIRPSARRRGLGTAILRLTLAEAARRGIERALLTCSSANAGSIAVIRANGGVLEDEQFIPERGERVQRWWIANAIPAGE
jgi:predicted acetyltransferase